MNLASKLSLKKRLARRYIPSSVKWESVLKGVGKLYRAIYDELEKDGDKSIPSEALSMPHRTVITAGRDESQIETLLKALKQKLKQELTETPMPAPKTV